MMDATEIALFSGLKGNNVIFCLLLVVDIDAIFVATPPSFLPVCFF